MCLHDIYVDIQMHIFALFLLCVSFNVYVLSRLCGGGSVGQYEAKPERIHKEDTVPGQSATQSGEDLQPHQRRTLVPRYHDLSTGQSH